MFFGHIYLVVFVIKALNWHGLMDSLSNIVHMTLICSCMIITIRGALLAVLRDIKKFKAILFSIRWNK